MDKWDIEVSSEESKFQIKFEDHFFVFSYRKPWGLMYLHKFLKICWFTAANDHPHSPSCAQSLTVQQILLHFLKKIKLLSSNSSPFYP